jgi:4-amino-4-deoxy-L-arabinose transferase-like glycosyltransferase
MTVRQKRTVGLAATGLIVLYVATRVSVMDRLPYFIDEGFFGQFTNQGAHSLHKLFVSLTIGKEPMQAWLSIPWVKLGLNPLVAGRVVAAIAGLMTVGVIGLLGRRLGGALVGWVAATLAVVLPFFFVNDAVGIVEPLVTLIIALALLLSLELAIRPGLKLGALLGAVLAVGVLTKQNAEPALLFAPLSLCCFDWSNPGRRRRLVVWFQAAVLAYALVVGAELLLRSSSYYRVSQLARNSLFYPARSVTSVLEDPFLTSAAAWRAFRPALSGYITIPLLAVALLGAALAWRERPRMAAVLLLTLKRR